MDESDISQSELARRLGVRKSAVHRTLNGNGNLRVDTIAEALAALGYELHVSACDRGEIMSAMSDNREPRCYTWLPGQVSRSPETHVPAFHSLMHRATYTVDVLGSTGPSEDEVVMFSVSDPRHHLSGPAALKVTEPGKSEPVDWAKPQERSVVAGRPAFGARSFTRTVG
ncbi:helix-turn-helix domain-containing protein [Isoptericola aurantiacus]|uniref:helix-turn-helix domain-containing protein n=1 Tax=Isoptericola aurantiacus TaxID=3377839 RepID=UPI00383AE388